MLNVEANRLATAQETMKNTTELPAVDCPVERPVRPLSEAARPVAWMNREGFAELQNCNGMSVWCENAALYEHPTEAHPSLMPVYDLLVAEAWRAFGLHAEREREVLKAALLQAQNAAIVLTHQDTQRQAEYEDLRQTMRDMARNHALQLEAARKHEPESVPELRAQLQTLGLWIAEALPTLDTVEPECSTEAELLTALIRRGEMLVLASLARGGALGPNVRAKAATTAAQEYANGTK